LVDEIFGFAVMSCDRTDHEMVHLLRLIYELVQRRRPLADSGESAVALLVASARSDYRSWKQISGICKISAFVDQFERDLQRIRMAAGARWVSVEEAMQIVAKRLGLSVKDFSRGLYDLAEKVLREDTPFPQAHHLRGLLKAVAAYALAACEAGHGRVTAAHLTEAAMSALLGIDASRYKSIYDVIRRKASGDVLYAVNAVFTGSMVGDPERLAAVVSGDRSVASSTERWLVEELQHIMPTESAIKAVRALEAIPHIRVVESGGEAAYVVTPFLNVKAFLMELYNEALKTEAVDAPRRLKELLLRPQTHSWANIVVADGDFDPKQLRDGALNLIVVLSGDPRQALEKARGFAAAARLALRRGGGRFKLNQYCRSRVVFIMHVGFGEYLLLKNSPIFKRRYAADGDVVLGCTIGCSFCYYRMIDATAPFIGTGMLKRLATPEEFAQAVAGSKLISERSLVIMGARGDASMYPDEVPKVLEAAEKLGVGAKFLALRRAPYDKAVAEHLASFDSLYYGTTITPKAREMGTPASEEHQLDGLRFVADFHRRVSVEVGPINLRNIDALRGILKALRDLGWDAAVYRGVSAGSWGIDRSAILNRLLKAGFLTEEQVRRSEQSYFYAVKNDLDAVLEAAVVEAFRDAGIKPYRHTGQFYAERWGIPVAKTRQNKVRRDVLEYAKAVEYPGRDLKRELERLGYADAEVELGEEGGVRVAKVKTSVPITEDVAMYLGEVTGLAVVAVNYLPSPDGPTLAHYLRHGFFWMPERARRAVEEALG
jgi:hypothetical protein